MVKIEAGGEYSASLVKRGQKDEGGEWQFIVVKDENTKSRLEAKLWVQSPVPIEQGSMFRVDAIYSGKLYMVEYKGAWGPKVEFSVDISPLMSYPEFTSMSHGAQDDDRLPW